MPTKIEQREATRKTMLEAARGAFAREGYAHVSTEALVRELGLTRGALYHHFGSKEGLFRAVVEMVQAEVGAQVVQAAERADNLWEALLQGCRAFLEATTNADTRRILLIDAPAVLGWETWRALDAQYSMQSLSEALFDLRASEDFIAVSDEEIVALTHLLSGAMNEAALWIAQSPEPQRALNNAMIGLEKMLNGLKLNG